MKTAPMLLLLLISASFGQTEATSKSQPTALTVELRASSNQVKLRDDIVLTVLLRSLGETSQFGMLLDGVCPGG